MTKQSLIQFRFILWGEGPLFLQKNTPPPFHFLPMGLVLSCLAGGVSWALRSGAARGGKEGKLMDPPYGWTSKNYVICVWWMYGKIGRQLICDNHTVPNPTNSLCTAVKVSASGGLRTPDPPIDPYLTSSLLQNPGGATGFTDSVGVIMV